MAANKRTTHPRPICHCGSGKLPGIMRERGWCCGECFNDFRQCPGPTTAQAIRTAIKGTVRGMGV